MKATCGWLEESTVKDDLPGPISLNEPGKEFNPEFQDSLDTS